MSAGRIVHGARVKWAAVPACLILVLTALGTAGAKPLTAKQILEKAADRYDMVKDYTVDARLSVESPSVHMPEMPVKIYYKKPDKLHIESEDGFAMLPRQGVVVGNPLRVLLSASDLSIAGSATVLGDDCHVIKGTVQQEGRSMESTVWISKKDMLVRQIHTNPEWGPSVKVKLWYTKVALKYWLPSTTTAQVSLPPFPGDNPENAGKPGSPTIVTIKFANYRVNTGLSDKIFAESRRAK